MVIFDVGKDYDDVVVLLVFKEFYCLGYVELCVVVVNLMLVDKRMWFVRVWFDVLGL